MKNSDNITRVASRNPNPQQIAREPLTNNFAYSIDRDRMSALEISPQPRPYSDRSARNLLALKNALEDEGELVPLDLLAALSTKGVIV